MKICGTITCGMDIGTPIHGMIETLRNGNKIFMSQREMTRVLTTVDTLRETIVERTVVL